MSWMEPIGIAIVLVALAVIAIKLLGAIKGGEPLALEALEGAAILLVDDSKTIRKVIELTLMPASVRLVCASEGEEAIAQLEQERFDIVIADVHVPGPNGYAICERAKKLDPERPVVLLVGTFEPFDEDLYRRSGADAFLKKPFDATELARQLEALAQKRKTGSGEDVR